MILTSMLLVTVLVLAARQVVASRFESRIASDSATIHESPAATVTTDIGLPPLLAAYVDRTGMREGIGNRWFRIEQSGEMRLRPGSRWKPFTAVQSFSVARPSFLWSARFGALQVVDRLIEGRGDLEVRLFGAIPVARAAGDETSRAQLLRYLAEVAWFPRAIAGDRFLSWQQIGDAKVRATLDWNDQHVELHFHFDQHGDIARVDGRRGRLVGGQVLETPWWGRFSDYGSVGGIRIPRRAAVGWVLDAGTFECWRGTVTGLQFG